MRRKIYLVIVALLSIATMLHATDYYVSVKGSDSNDGSESMPFRTIQKAADVMVAGETCYINPAQKFNN